MENKILVIVYVPLLEDEYSIFIPVNKKIGTIRNNIIQTITELSEGGLKISDQMGLYDSEKATVYDNNVYVNDSGITNGTKLILM